MQPRSAKDRLESNTGGCNPALPAGSPQRSAQLWTGQTVGLSRSRRNCQNGTSIRMRQATGTAVLKSFDECRIVVT